MEKRTHILPVRLSDAELRRLEELCRISGLPASRIVRKWLAEEKLKPRRPEAVRDLYVEINRIGNNINQIARKFNAGFGTSADLREVMALLRSIEEKMAAIADR